MESDHTASDSPELQALHRALAAIPGGVSALAERLTITPQAIYKWRRVPPGRVLIVEEMAGGRVSREELRPDIFARTTADSAS